MNEANPVRRVSEARAFVSEGIQHDQIASLALPFAKGGFESVVVGEGKSDFGSPRERRR